MRNPGGVASPPTSALRNALSGRGVSQITAPGKAMLACAACACLCMRVYVCVFVKKLSPLCQGRAESCRAGGCLGCLVKTPFRHKQSAPGQTAAANSITSRRRRESAAGTGLGQGPGALSRGRKPSTARIIAHRAARLQRTAACKPIYRLFRIAVL